MEEAVEGGGGVASVASSTGLLLSAWSVMPKSPLTKGSRLELRLWLLLQKKSLSLHVPSQEYHLQFNNLPQHHCRIPHHGRKIGRQEPQGGEERKKGQIRQEEQERQEVVCREARKGRDRRCFITRRQEGCQPGPFVSVCRTGMLFSMFHHHVHPANQYSPHHPLAKRLSRSPNRIQRMRTS